MKTVRKIRHISTGVLAILTLSVSSVAACACSHHRAETQVEPSCHSSASHHSQPKRNANRTGSHAGESCECVGSATRLSVKAEGFKLKKHPASEATATDIESVGFYSAAPATVNPIESPLYATSFYFSTAARGPPLT